MTTGRINQVTILNLGAEATQATPRRGQNICYQMEGETPKRPQPSASRAQKRAGTAGDYSIAPTEFPKDAVRGKVSLGLTAARTRCIRPSGGEDLRSVTPKRRIPNVAIPENLMERLA